MLENLFSVVLFFSLGYIFRKFKIFTEESSKTLIDFIIYVAFPALVIYNVQFLELKISYLWILVLGWIAIIFSIIISFLAGKFLKLNRITLASFVMMASFGNTSFLGIPFNMALFGEESVKYVIIFDQFASFLPVVILSPFILAYGQGTGSIKIDWKKIITFPPFITLIFSFLIKPFFHIPDFILGSLHLLGLTVVPLALFSVGLNLRFSNLKERIRDVTAVLFIKMIFVPSVFLAFFIFAGIESGLFTKVAIIEIAMPPMVLASILVIGAGLDKDLAASSVASGIIFSFFSVPVFYILINRLIF